eukprot:g5650.t1
MTKTTTKQWIFVSAVLLALSLALAALGATQQHVQLHDTPKHMSWPAAFLYQAPSWLVLAPMVAGVFVVVRRYPPEGKRMRSRLALYALASVLFGLVFLFIAVPVRHLFHPAPVVWSVFGAPFYKSGPQWAIIGVLSFWAALLVGAYADARRRLVGLETAVETQEQSEAPAPVRIRFETRTGRVVIDPAAITHITAEPRGARVHTLDGPIDARASLTRLEEELTPHAIVRVHRSCLVNLAHVREVRGSSARDGTVHLSSGESAPVSRRRWGALGELGRSGADAMPEGGFGRVSDPRTRAVVARFARSPPMLMSLVLVLASPTPVRFQALPPVEVGPMPTRPVLADMDKDGDLDVVVACGPCCGRDPDPRSGHAQVLYNDGRGVLAPRRTPIKLLDTALGVALGDLNEDGWLDAVAFHHSSYEAAVLLGDGRGGLGSPSYFTLHDGESAHVHSIALADVNHDGHLDALTTLVDDHAMSVHLGDGAGGFTPALAQPFFAHRHPYAGLKILDLNHDTHPDALLTDVRGNGLTVLSGSGTGMFSSSRGFSLHAHTPVTSAERPMSAAVGDVDNDGDPDAMLAIEEAPQAVLMLNDGDGNFTETASAPLELAVPTTGITLVDLNGDGTLDLVHGGTACRAFGYRLGGGDGHFASPQRVDSLGEDPSVSVGDMNGDGRPDVVAANYDSGTVVVLLSRGD